jgi:ATP-dependent DNA helicase DinG
MAKRLELKEIFKNSGRLADILPDYECRPQQSEMSEKIYHGLREGVHVLVEAGTGTGKTLAYLAPAVLSGKKVVITTGTKALQEQLYYKDIPLIRKAIPITFRAAYMKGRSNYLCLNRFLEFSAFPLFDHPEQGKLFKEIQTWAKQTQTGDVAELADVGENSYVWRQINSGTETCMGGKCPDQERCFITAMRREAVKADLLIVNHHLFFADLSVKEKGYGGVIPDYDAVIFDEAHMIEDVATHHFGIQVSNYRTAELMRDTRQGLRELKGAGKVKEIEQICNDLDEKARVFFSIFHEGPERNRILKDHMEDNVSVKEAGLFNLLTLLEQRIKQVSPVNDTLASCARRAGEIHEDLQVIMDTDDPDRVCWREIRGKGIFLHASPIDISDEMNAKVFSSVSCAVLTSATLKTGGNFEFIKRRLGIERAEESSFPSPFDFASQVVLYLPKMDTEPNGPGFVQEAAGHIEQILKRTSGRALILFTSNRHLNGVYDILEGTIDYPLLKQGDASRELLLARFRDEKESVLLATRSFWQGIDVQGDALSCVIIDKLPFASPSEPLVAARIHAIRTRGGNPFFDYQVPEAAISLKQGFGRLIRNRKDRGVLSILDNRIHTRSYGKYFIQSLSEYPMTHNVGGVEKIFPDQNGEHSLSCVEKR